MAFWEPNILEFPELELRSGSESGEISCQWGNLVFIPTAFESEPPEKMLVDLDWGMTSALAFKLYQGTVLRKSFTREKLTYDIYRPDMRFPALDKGVDENGDECVKPMIFGTVSFMYPQRTGTESEFRYYRPDFDGEIGTDWHAFDDGVQIDDHWTDHGDGTVSRSIDVVGRLSFSGTGTRTNLADVFEWGVARMGCTLENRHGADIPVDCVIDSQTQTLDFLGKVSWYCCYRFYLRDRVMTLVSLAQHNGQNLLGEFGFFSPVYTWPERVKSMTAEWDTKYAADSAIETQAHKITLEGHYPLEGVEKTVQYVFNESEALVLERMEELLSYIEKPEIEIKIPIYRFPNPLEKYIFSDNFGNTDQGVEFLAESVQMDYRGKTVTVKGKGSVTFT